MPRKSKSEFVQWISIGANPNDRYYRAYGAALISLPDEDFGLGLISAALSELAAEGWLVGDGDEHEGYVKLHPPVDGADFRVWSWRAKTKISPSGKWTNVRAR